MVVTVLTLMVAGQAASYKLVPTGMTQKMGGYMPIRAEMKSEAAGVKKAPDGLSAALYGTIDVGGKAYGFIIDEPEGKAQRLFVDSNGDGDYTNDPAAVFTARKQGDSTMYMGTAQVSLNGTLVSLGVYRFDKNDPQRAALKSTLLYYYDFGYEGTITLGKDSYPIAFTGAVAKGARIWIDRNKNGKSDGRAESIMAGTPFNVGGTSYDLVVDNGVFKPVVSAQKVEEVPLPPNLTVGQPVPNFEATATDGTKISFPKSFKGKLVMIDFWATWCGPCIAELPNVLKAYDKFHDKGFEVLGISLDRAGDGDKLASFTKEHNMAWKQVFEGKFWDITIGKQFGVEAIPFCLLVDGDTGQIVATVANLRGEQLEKTLDAALAKKNKGGK